MLQMRRDKLNRVLSQHNCAPAKKQFANNSVTLGEADIQGVLRENVTVERILARRKLRDRDEAVTSLSIAADLDDVVNSKLFELQQTCASGLRAAQASSGVPKFALSKPAGSKRRQVLSVLSLLEQWTELFKPLMVNAQLAASMPSVSQGDKKKQAPEPPEPLDLNPATVGAYLAELPTADLAKLLAATGPVGHSMKAMFSPASEKQRSGESSDGQGSGKPTNSLKHLGQILQMLGLDNVLCAKQFEAKASALDASVATMRDAAALLEAKLAEAQSEVNSLRAEISDSGSKKSAELQKARTLQQSLEKQLEELRSSSAENASQMRGKVVEAQAAASAQASAVVKLEAELLKLREEVQDSDNNSNSAAEQTALQAELESAKQRLNQMAAENITLQTHAKGSHHRVQSLEKEINDLTAAHNEAMAAAHRKTQQVENKCADLEREIEMMKLELDSYDKRISDMRMKRMKAEADLANSSGQVADFNDTFEEVMEEEFAALRSSFAAQIKSLKEELQKQTFGKQSAVREAEKTFASERTKLLAVQRRQQSQIANLEEELARYRQSASLVGS
eukprot:INCI7226.4.p1 GENE.INCI7226.4~~INCI7226.4.p1  ORF type:complete len:566 (-),score=151.30 INCI7226.4:2958-4655(-)